MPSAVGEAAEKCCLLPVCLLVSSSGCSSSGGTERLSHPAVAVSVVDTRAVPAQPGEQVCPLRPGRTRHLLRVRADPLLLLPTRPFIAARPHLTLG